MPRVHALDGLRGLAVAAVLAYHAGFGWARGGFLGVSLFFTLSGFLITSLLVHEHDATGGISLRRFWLRRARRLLPAATVALGGILVFGATVASGSQLRGLRGDVLGALGYVANWRFVLAGASYGDLWSSPSPVQHFWSLAVEEQLYVVLPLVVVGALALGTGRRRTLLAALGAALAGSVAATFLVDDRLRAYYGTDVRAAELLAGAILAVALAGRPATTSSPASTTAGLGALAVLLATWATTTQTDGRLYSGGLLVHAALVVVVIIVARDAGPLAALLSARPLRWLGRVSYGAYLYHWPIFLWLTEARTGTSDATLAALRIATSLAAASLSAALVEEPIRAGRTLTARRGPLALGASAAAIAACLVVVTTAPPAPRVGADLSAAPGLVAPSTLPVAAFRPSTTAAPAAAATTSVRPGPGVLRSPVPRAPGEPLRVYVAGDSNAFILGLKLLEWGTARGVQVWTSGWFGCHIVPGGTYRWANQPKHTEDKCNRWRETRAREIAEIRPHVVLVIYGSFDLLDRKWDGAPTWTHIGMPDFDEALTRNIAEMTDLLGTGGALVIWATYPRVRTGVVDGVPPPHDFPEVADYRVDRLNTFIRQAVEARPFARVLELRRHMQAWPNGELDPVRRPDGIHPSDNEAAGIAAWAGAQLVAEAGR